MAASSSSARLAGQVAVVVGAALNALPAAPLQRAVDGISLLAWTLSPARRRATAGNYAALLHQRAETPRIRRLVRRAFKNYGRMSLAFLTVSHVSDDQLMRRVHVYGLEHVQSALEGGRGAILVLPHLGNWDLAARYCLAHGFPLTAVVESDWSAEFAARTRTKVGLRVVPRARSLRPLLRALQRNEMIALLCDVAPPGVPAVDVCFAGQPAYLPAGPARLAITTGAPLLPSAAVTLADGTTSVGVTGAIRPTSRTASATQVRQLMQEVARHFEQLIGHFPDQWYAFHPLNGAARAV